MIVGRYTHCGPSYIELNNNIPIVMRFWAHVLVGVAHQFYASLQPTDPSITAITGESPETVRFACLSIAFVDEPYIYLKSR